MSEFDYITKETYEKLLQELQDLKTKERSKVAAAIAEAREKGDLSENAEYDAAREAQAHLEHKIAKLEEYLANVKIISKENIDTSKAYILTKVTVKNHNNNKVITYQLVSQKEANAKENKISVDSPVGKGLLGKQVGDIVEITVPAGVLKLELLEITV